MLQFRWREERREECEKCLKSRRGSVGGGHGDRVFMFPLFCGVEGAVWRFTESKSGVWAEKIHDHETCFMHWIDSVRVDTVSTRGLNSALSARRTLAVCLWLQAAKCSEGEQLLCKVSHCAQLSSSFRVCCFRQTWTV